MKFTKGDSVRYKEGLLSGAHHVKQGERQVGTVVQVHDTPPGRAHPVVDIQFKDEPIEPGISITQIEHV